MFPLSTNPQNPVVRPAWFITITLFTSRAFAEVGGLWLWPIGAVVGGTLGIGLGYFLAWQLKHNKVRWPLFFLWIYILYPTYSPQVMFGVLIVTLIAYAASELPNLNTGLQDSLIFSVFLVLYWLTLAPDLQPADAGEFQMVAAHWGIAHPPGYPLYSLIGNLFARIVPNAPTYGISLFSAITAALTAMLISRAVRSFSGSGWAGFAAALFYGTAASVWATATQASIRPLTGFFAALCVERLSAYWLTRRESALLGFMLALGLGITHHPSLAFPGIIFCVYVLLIDPPLATQLSRWPRLLGMFALGFAPWLYIVLVARLNPEFAPPGVETWDGFWRHVFASGFSGDVFYVQSASALWDRTLVWLNILQLQWSILALGIVIITAGLVLWRNKRIFFLLAGSLVLHSIITMTYRAPQTVEYLIPAYMSLAVLSGTGLGYALRPPDGQTAPLLFKGLRAASPLLLGVMVAACLFRGAETWPSFHWLSSDRSTYQYVEDIFEEAPENAVILANWHWATPLWTLQANEGLRPDLDVIYVFPDGDEPLAATWIRRIEDNIGERPVIVTQYFPAMFEASPFFFEPLRSGWQVREQPRRDLPEDTEPLDVVFDNGVSLVGIERIGTPIAQIGQAFDLRLAWRVDQVQVQDLTGFLHLTRVDGTYVAGWDRRLPTSRAAPGDILIETYTIASPVDLPVGNYVLQAGIYGHADDGSLVSGLSGGQIRVPIGDIAPQPAKFPAPTAHARRFRFANGAEIYGMDWEGDTLHVHGLLADGTTRTLRGTRDEILEMMQAHMTDGSARLGPWGIPLGSGLPLRSPDAGERYVPLGGQVLLSRVRATPTPAANGGNEVVIVVDMLASRPLVMDNVIKVDIAGDGWNVQDDSIPATGAIPTLKWLYGWQVSDRHRIVIPTGASSPAAYADLLVYDNFTGQRLPILDPALAEQGIDVRIVDWTP